MGILRTNRSGLPDERGIALLLVLWVIVFLAFICAEFSWTMRTETATAVNFKEGSQAYYAAEAGVNRAIIELLRVSASSRGSTRAVPERDAGMDGSGENPDDADDVYDELQLWLAGGGPYRFELGDFYCEVSIIDESNKVNINSFLNQSKKDPTRLKAFLGSQVGLEGEELDTVADSLIDWWDKDSNVTGLSGAEEDYYASLDPPYPCRNADLPVIEDCLLVRGVTERIFYGQGRRMEERIALSPDELEQFMSGGGFDDELIDGEDGFGDPGLMAPRLGLADVFSVTSSSTSFQVNINSASYEQLMLLPGMDSQSAREIIAERAVRLFESPTDRLPQFANYEVWKNMIKVQRPFAQNTYTIVSRGFSRDGRISRTIRCSLLVSNSKCIISDWRTDG
ncbi:MAG: general secretion pathway protein GspK [Deltaproteobacteria bacterium]|nr:general secretion pathway protein GspK [Deltaproteobacteria bacterium]